MVISYLVLSPIGTNHLEKVYTYPPMHEDTWQALITPPSLILAGHALHSSFHFIFQEQRKERRERSSPPSAGRKPLEETTP